jgi:nucleobase:cation symporter-1, NCS1 family
MAEAQIAASELGNKDLNPTLPHERNWTALNLAALWVGMAVCIPTYMLAGSLISQGMNWWQAMLAILFGNLIVMIPMILNGHAGTKYGIPFPVFARASFGVYGAHIPSIARAIVACGWFGIQTYVGGEAISAMIGILWEPWTLMGAQSSFIGMSFTSWISFLLFWTINIFFVWKGHNSIKWLETFAAPFLLLAGMALMYWAVSKVGGIGIVLEQSSALSNADSSLSGFPWFVAIFLPGMTAMVGFWATLSMNIPDFTRYCKTQKDQVLGQFLGLPTTMILFSFIGVVVTSATVILYGKAIWDPVELLSTLSRESNSPVIAFVAMFVLALATLSTNIAANIVSPANSFANAFPKKISFRIGGLIAGVLGIVMCPWLVLDKYIGWLVSYSGLLGAVGGVMIADYWIIRKGKLNLSDLYQVKGIYHYQSGFNIKAIISVLAAIAVILLGQLVPTLAFLFQGAWFTGVAVSLSMYLYLMRKTTS